MKNSLTHTHTHTHTNAAFQRIVNVATSCFMIALLCLAQPAKAQPYAANNYLANFTSTNDEWCIDGLLTADMAISIGYMKGGGAVPYSCERLNFVSFDGSTVLASARNAYTPNGFDIYNTYGTCIEKRITTTCPDPSFPCTLITAGNLFDGGGAATTAGASDPYIAFVTPASNYPGFGYVAYRYESPDDDYVMDIKYSNCPSCPTPDTYLITGYCTDPASATTMPFIMRIDETGAIVYEAKYKITDASFALVNTEAYSITEDAANNVYICGQSVDGAGNKDGFVLKTDATLAPVWANTYGAAGAADESFRSILVNNAGRLVTTGWSDNVTPIGATTNAWATQIDAGSGSLGMSYVSNCSDIDAYPVTDTKGYSLQMDPIDFSYFVNGVATNSIGENYNTTLHFPNSFTTPDPYIIGKQVGISTPGLAVPLNYHAEVRNMGGGDNNLFTFNNTENNTSTTNKSSCIMQTDPAFGVFCLALPPGAPQWYDNTADIHVNALAAIGVNNFTWSGVGLKSKYDFGNIVLLSCPSMRLYNPSALVDASDIAYPNPCDEQVQIPTSQGVIALYDLQGKRCKESVIDQKEDKLILSTADLQNGLYWITVTNNEVTQKYKIIVQH